MLNIYKELCDKMLDNRLIDSYKNNGYKFVHILSRIVLENSFDLTLFEGDPQKFYYKLKDNIKWSSLVRPLFLYTGLMYKKLNKNKQKDIQNLFNNFLKESTNYNEEDLIQICLYIIQEPFKTFDLLLSHTNFKKCQAIWYVNSDLYCTTLLCLNYIISQAIPKLSKSSRIMILTNDQNLSKITFKMLVNTNYSNEFIINLCRLGLKYYSEHYIDYVLYQCGNNLFNIITIQNCSAHYNIINLNTSSKISSKNNIKNYIIHDDKYNISTKIPGIYMNNIKQNWSIDRLIFIKDNCKGAIINIDQYLELKSVELPIQPPILKQVISSCIDYQALYKTIENNVKKNSYKRIIPDKFYKYIVYKVKHSTKNIDRILYITHLRKLFNLDILEPSLATMYNELYILWQLPSTWTNVYIVDEHDIEYYKDNNDKLALNILLNYGFLYIIGQNHVNNLYRCYDKDNALYTCGTIINTYTENNKIISEFNRLLYKDILRKFYNSMTKIFTEWGNKLIRSELPPSLILMLYSRLTNLYAIECWV